MLLEKRTKLACSSKSVVLAALAIIGIIAVYNWIVAPHANNLMAAQRHKQVTDALVKKNETISKDVVVKRKKLEELQDEFKQVHTSLFDPIGAKKFFSDIEVMAKDANCIIRSLNVSQTGPAPTADQSKASSYITANLATLSVVGDYKNIVAMMSKLQNRSEQVLVDSVSIKLMGSSSNQLKCDMTITIYVIQNKEEHADD